MTITSNNLGDNQQATVGDVVTLSIISSEFIYTPTVFVAGGKAAVDDLSDADGTTWSASYTLNGEDEEGTVSFNIDYQDGANNAGLIVSTITGGNDVIFDKTAPVLGFDQDGLTNNVVTLSGTTDDLVSSINVSLDGGMTLTDGINNGDGTWFYDLSSDPNFAGDGFYTLDIQSVDAPLNQGTFFGSYILDQTGPTISIDPFIAGDDIIDASEYEFVTISGSSDEEGGIVTLTIEDGLSPIFFNPTVTEGFWSVDIDFSTFNEGLITILADIIDEVGNEGSQASASVTLDYSVPSIEGNDLPFIVENQSTVGLYESDEAVTWSLSGDDFGFFSIDEFGNLSFAVAPDFEAIGDLNADNIYEVTLEGTDGNNNIGFYAVSVTVTDEDEIIPTISGTVAPSILENTTVVGYMKQMKQ